MQGCVDLSEFMATLDSVCPSSVDYDCEPKTYCQINLLKRNRKDSLFMEEQTNAFVEELTVEKQQIHTGETLGKKKTCCLGYWHNTLLLLEG